MTINTTLSRNSHISIGGTVYTYGPYKVNVKEDMSVYVDGVQENDANWNISNLGNEAGGDVTFLVAVDAGKTVTLIRELEITQETDYVDYDAFPAEDHEDALDKACMINQQQEESLSRAVVAGIDYDPNTDLTWPPYAAGSGIGWSITEQALVNFINLYVDIAGDIMTGHLGLPAGPAATEATRRDYVDAADAILQSAIDSINNLKANKANETHTGNTNFQTIICSIRAQCTQDPLLAADLTRKSWVDTQIGDIVIDYEADDAAIIAAYIAADIIVTNAFEADDAAIIAAYIAADLLKFDKTGGTVSGEVIIGPTAAAVSEPALTVKSRPLPIGNLQEWTNNSDVVLSGVDINGQLFSEFVVPVVDKHLTRKDYVDNKIIAATKGGLVDASISAPGALASTDPIPFNTEAIDSLNEYNTGTYIFTASKSGIYSFGASVLAAPSVSGSAWSIRAVITTSMYGSGTHIINGSRITSDINELYILNGIHALDAGDTVVFSPARLGGSGDFDYVANSSSLNIAWIGQLPVGLP